MVVVAEGWAPFPGWALDGPGLAGLADDWMSSSMCRVQQYLYFLGAAVAAIRSRSLCLAGLAGDWLASSRSAQGTDTTLSGIPPNNDSAT